MGRDVAVTLIVRENENDVGTRTRERRSRQNFKFQIPNSKETPNTKYQTPKRASPHRPIWSLELGAYLVFGSWILVFHFSLWVRSWCLVFHEQIPQQNGSFSSSSKVASEFTKAVPVMTGAISPLSRFSHLKRPV